MTASTAAALHGYTETMALMTPSIGPSKQSSTAAHASSYAATAATLKPTSSKTSPAEPRGDILPADSRASEPDERTFRLYVNDPRLDCCCAVTAPMGVTVEDTR